MSSDTAPSTSKSSDPSAGLPIAFGAGFCFAALQSVYFRELLSVFSGNELSIGMILSVWLLATGASTAYAGQRYAARHDRPYSITLIVGLLCAAAAAGFFAIRLSRLVFGSGITIGPLAMLCVVAVSVVPFTFINGFLLGTLFSGTRRAGKGYGALYGAENAGAVAGALMVFCFIVLSWKNNYIAAASLVPFLCVAISGRFSPLRPWAAVFAAACIACLIRFDHASLQWKYPGIRVSGLLYGHEGEIVSLPTGTDTSFLVNGALYKSTMEKPALEQAVHIPMAQRPRAVRALVVFDRGQGAELSKYPALAVDIIETEPAFALHGGRASGGAARVAAIESFRPAFRYDAVFLGTGIPYTAASNRFYTSSFFLKIKSLMSDSGLFTFSLPFSENYLSRSEHQLYEALFSTLSAAWKNVAVFPGEGYTFMASDGPCVPLPRVYVQTKYLASSILPGVSEERIQSANKLSGTQTINTREKPVTLSLGLQMWLERFTGSMWVLLALLLGAFIAICIFLPKNRNTISIATSGLAAGIYSICLLLLYQATYGALYSRVSLLLVSLTAGFAVGSFAKKFPLSDLLIGLYAVVSLCVLVALPFPPAFLFYLFHAGIGVLAGAQFVSFGRANAPASLYAADLFGGAIGMAVCSTLVVPLVGIMPVAGGIFVVKAVVEAVNRRRGGKDVPIPSSQ